jgi:uncharacterized membrane protein
MKNRLWHLMAASVLAAFCCSAAVADEPPYFMGLGQLPEGSWSSAQAISEDGRVVAGYGFNFERVREAFRWTAEDGMQGLGFLNPNTGLRFSIAMDISADGTTIVGSSRYGCWFDQIEGFRWTADEGMVGLGWIPDPPGLPATSQAAGVSGDGSIVVGLSGSVFRPSVAFRWTEDEDMTVLDDFPSGDWGSRATSIADDGVIIAGSSVIGNQPGYFLRRNACYWRESGKPKNLGIPGGYDEAEAQAVSKDGEWIVGRAVGEEYVEAFRWTQGGGMQLLGWTSGRPGESEAYGVAKDGEFVVGYSYDRDTGSEAFIWTEWNGMRPLLEVLVTEVGLDLDGWQLTDAYDITGDGKFIVGAGVNPDGDSEAWLVFLGDPIRITGD